jgi:hypothetical protein
MSGWSAEVNVGRYGYFVPAEVQAISRIKKPESVGGI